MTVEIATLMYRVDATEAEHGIDVLKRMEEQGGRTEAAVGRLKGTTDTSAASQRAASQAHAEAKALLDKLVGASTAYGQAQVQVAKATQSVTTATDIEATLLTRNAKLRGDQALQAARDADRAAQAQIAAAERSAAGVAAAAAKEEAAWSRLNSVMDKRNVRTRGDQALQAIKAETAATAALDAQITSAMRTHEAMNATLTRGVGASRAATQAGLNLSRQFADIAVTGAMGMSPLMILIQQGPQVADAFATAKTQGLGFSGVMKSLGIQLGLVRAVLPPTIQAELDLAAAQQATAATALEAAAAGRAKAAGTAQAAAADQAAAVAAAELSAANEVVASTATKAAAAEKLVLAPLAEALGILAGVAAVAAAGFGLMNHELEKGYPKDVTKDLGLTSEQLDRVKDKTVTLGDTWKATLDVMGKYLSQGPVGDAIKGFEKLWTATLDIAAKFAFEATARIVGSFIGALTFITTNWRNFPAVMGDLFVMAVNAALDATQRLVNGAIKAINIVFAAARVFPQYSWLPELKEVDLGRFKGQVSGAFSFIGRAAQDSIGEAVQRTRVGMNQIFSEIKKGAEGTATKRALKQAGDADDPRAIRAAKEAVDEEANAFLAFEKSMKAARIEAEKFQHFKKPDLIPDIGAQIDARDAQQRSDALNAYADLVDDVANRTRDAAQGMSDAFGSVGSAIGNLTAILADYDSRQAGIAARRASEAASYADLVSKGRVEDTDRAREAASLASAQRQSAAAQIDLYGDVAAAASSFFGQQTAAYKVLHTAEEAFRLFQFAMAAKAIFWKSAEATTAVATASTTIGANTAVTASTVVQSAIQATAHGVVAIARAIASLPFPFNLAAGAATAAALVGFGVKVFGGGGGGGASGATSAEDRQKSQGTGSVLGDASAKSDSIAKSLEIVSKNSFEDLQYSNAMLRSLQSIDSQIGSVAAAVAKTVGIGGSLSTDGLGLGTTTKQGGLVSRGVGALGGAALGGIAGAAVVNGALGLGLSGAIGAGLAGIGVQIGSLLGPIGAIAGAVLGPLLFNSKTTVSLLDQGVKFEPQTLAQILAGGVSGSTYQDVQATTKNSFLGIGIGSKSKTSTVTGSLDDEFTKQVGLLFTSLRSGVLEAAKVLGVEGADALIDAVNLNLGKISFKDLKPDEIEAALNAVFSKAADDLAGAAIPGLTSLQKAGEGLFETLTRVANDYQVLDLSLQSIGKQFGATGLASLAAREDLIALAGGLDSLVDATKSYSQAILTEDQQMAPVVKAVAAELERLGLAGLKTKAQFSAVVDGLDLTTAAGQAEYVALLALAPAFAKATDYMNQLTGAANDNASLADKLSSERSKLSDAYERESGAIKDTRDQFQNFADTLHKFRSDLDTGPNAQLSPEAAYQAAKAQFETTKASALGGDQNAIGDLQSVSQAYLDASKSYYASSQGYFDDLAAVKTAVTSTEAYARSQVSAADQQLAALDKMVEGQLGVKGAVLSVAEELKIIEGLLGKAATITGSGSGSAFDAATYGADNADLIDAFKAYSQGSNPYGFTAGLDQAAFLKEHYDRTGQYEIAQGLRKFATGGDGMVGGSGGTDSKVVSIQATPGELVSVRTPAQQGDSKAQLDAIRDLNVRVEQLTRIVAAQTDIITRQQAAIHEESQKTRREGVQATDGVRKAVKAA